MIEKINWEKVNGLVPAIVQSCVDGTVLMLGYMNEDALRLTRLSGEVCFFSRTRKRLWRKGESSGNVLKLVDIYLDCDSDTLLVVAEPTGPVCHTGKDNCFGYSARSPHFLETLEKVIEERIEGVGDGSYTHALVQKGCARVAQKVGEEGVEVAVASALGERDQVVEESADLLFHLMVNLQAQGLRLADVIGCLKERHMSKTRG